MTTTERLGKTRFCRSRTGKVVHRVHNQTSDGYLIACRSAGTTNLHLTDGPPTCKECERRSEERRKHDFGSASFREHDRHPLTFGRSGSDRRTSAPATPEATQDEGPGEHEESSVAGVASAGEERGVYEEMQAAGCFPYEDPENLDLESVDPLIRPAVEAINLSGWVWTGESCQGHPDAEHRFVWAGNTDPFLRLLCRTPDEGRMMSCLLAEAVASGYNPNLVVPTDEQAMAADEEATYSPSLRITANHRAKGWTEVLVYVEASTVWARNMGCRFFERFAQALNAHRPRVEENPPREGHGYSLAMLHEMLTQRIVADNDQDARYWRDRLHEIAYYLDLDYLYKRIPDRPRVEDANE